VILDLDRFIVAERPHWQELENLLQRLEISPGRSLAFDDLKRLHVLYQRASADLAKVSTSSAEPQIRRYLVALVGRAYGEIHETRSRPHRLAPWRFFTRTFPAAFRRHARAFALSAIVTGAGVVFGGATVVLDPGAKDALMPFAYLDSSPTERVKREESDVSDRLHGSKTTLSAFLMTQNTQVAILCLSLGMSWGIGTVVLLFYNGAVLGAVIFDYLMAGQGRFLCGWLLPHGVVEIPAFLIAGQAGLVLAAALIGWGDRTPARTRLRRAWPDLGALIGGVAVLLVWSGFVESFLSQYHEPVLPYSLKIGFGALEALLLTLFLARSGSKSGSRDTRA